ncbi:MAG: molybdopterin molybdotransferase, partial [Sulfitobacter sp.]
MISTEQALEAIFALISPLSVERVPLRAAVGRVLAGPVAATRNQPPFAASSMDGYAVVSASPGDVFEVVGEAQAGARFTGAVQAGEAVRIFTGAPVPKGATRIVIQEDVTRVVDQITLGPKLDRSTYIRPVAGDFAVGTTLGSPCRLAPAHVAL